MKIQKVTEETRPKIYALLQRAFPYTAYEVELVQKLHENNRVVHEWVCIHTSKVIGYIEPGYYSRFGFEPCNMPICLFDRNNAHFLSMRYSSTALFNVGYEPEFKPAAKPPAPKRKKHRER